jgi:hypothetical protein
LAGQLLQEGGCFPRDRRGGGSKGEEVRKGGRIRKGMEGGKMGRR